jgi:hypothetical protein
MPFRQKNRWPRAAKVCARQRLSSERSERAAIKIKLNIAFINSREPGDLIDTSRVRHCLWKTSA